MNKLNYILIALLMFTFGSAIYYTNWITRTVEVKKTELQKEHDERLDDYAWAVVEIKKDYE